MHVMGMECDLCFEEDKVLIQVCSCSSKLCMDCLAKLSEYKYKRCILCQCHLLYHEKNLQLIPLLSNHPSKKGYWRKIFCCFNTC